MHVPLLEKTEALSWPLSPRSRRFALRSTLSTVHERLDYHQEGPKLVPKITQVTTKLRWKSVSLSCIWHFTLNTKKAADKGWNTFQSGDTPNQKQNEFANTYYLPPAEIQSKVISKKSRGSCHLDPYRCTACGFLWQGCHLTTDRYCSTFERLRRMIWSHLAWFGARILSFCTIRPDPILPDLWMVTGRFMQLHFYSLHIAPSDLQL